MKKHIKPYKIIILAALVLLIALTMRVKVVPVQQYEEISGNTTFDAESDVADFWDSKAIPELKEKAFELSDFLNEANGDLNSLAEKYGVESVGSVGTVTYTAKATGVVTESDLGLTSNNLTVKIDGYDGDVKVVLQLGKIFKGTAVRDSLSFIDFNNYTNQVDWAGVSKSIHSVIMDTVVAPLDLENINGKHVEFIGCFTIDDNTSILITPVVLNVTD